MSRIERRPGSLAILLAGGVLFLAGAGLFCSLAPVVRCRKCPRPFATFPDDSIVIAAGSSGSPIQRTPEVYRCDLCGDGLKVTLVSKWLGRSWWEGRTIGALVSRGFGKNSTTMLDRAGITLGNRITKGSLEDVRSKLLDSGEFRFVEIEVYHDPRNPERVKVATQVVEK